MIAVERAAHTAPEFPRLRMLRTFTPSLPFDCVRHAATSECTPLWCAVLAQAVEDALIVAPERIDVPRTLGPRERLTLQRKNAVRNRMLRDQKGASRWLMSSSEEPGSFRWVCDTVLNYHPEGMLRKLRTAYPALSTLAAPNHVLTLQLAPATVSA